MEKCLLSISLNLENGQTKWLWWWWAGNGRQLREEGWSVRMINSRCPELAAERKKRILCLLAGSGHPRCLYFHLVGKLWSVRMSLFSRRETKVMNKVSFGRRWIWIFLSFFLFQAGAIKQYILIYEWWWSIKTWALLGRDPPRNPGS